jgi:peptide subunit release factor RF-3
VIDDELRNKNGESVTNTVTSFPIPRGDYIFNFIDTPGLADTRGLERDQ